MFSPKTAVRDRLRSWAAGRGVALDADGYTATVDDNLFEPMSEATRYEFEQGRSGELGSAGRRGKMQALHSSAALVCNFFDRWRGRDKAVLSEALDLEADIVGMGFERQFPTVLPGIPPTLDVVLALADDSIVASSRSSSSPTGGAAPQVSGRSTSRRTSDCGRAVATRAANASQRD